MGRCATASLLAQRPQMRLSKPCSAESVTWHHASIRGTNVAADVRCRGPCLRGGLALAHNGGTSSSLDWMSSASTPKARRYFSGSSTKAGCSPRCRLSWSVGSLRALQRVGANSEQCTLREAPVELAEVRAPCSSPGGKVKTRPNALTPAPPKAKGAANEATPPSTATREPVAWILYMRGTRIAAVARNGVPTTCRKTAGNEFLNRRFCPPVATPTPRRGVTSTGGTRGVRHGLGGHICKQVLELEPHGNVFRLFRKHTKKTTNGNCYARDVSLYVSAENSLRALFPSQSSAHSTYRGQG